MWAQGSQVTATVGNREASAKKREEEKKELK